MAESPENLRQRQALETRAHLVTAACEVFEERGYQATSVGAITARAKTAHGTFYLYFKNKEDLFCQVMETVIINELLASARVPDPTAGSRERLEGMVRGFFEAYAPHTGLWRAVLEAALVSPRVQEIWLKLRRALVQVVAAGLREGQAAGEVRALDADLSAYALAAMVDWFLFLHMEMHEPPSKDDDYDAGIDVLVDLWHHAVYGEIPD